MRPEEFKTRRVLLPDFCGGTYLDVISMGSITKAQVYDHVMTETGVYLLMPDDKLNKTEADKAADLALHLDIETVPKGKLIIMSGPSASGKSSRARQLLKADGHAVRINRDELRNMTTTDYDSRKEQFIIDVEKAVATVARKKGYNVIIDDTNLTSHHIEMWMKFAEEHYFRQIEIQKLTTPLEECVARDAVRTNYKTRVGRPVIELQFLKGKLIDWGTKPVVFCDLDGTLTDPNHRAHLASGVCPTCNGQATDIHYGPCITCGISGKVKKDWVKFEQQCINDKPVQIIRDWLWALRSAGYTIVLMSGRQIGLAGKETTEWLSKYLVPYDHLFMRHGRDGRKDTVIKNELLQMVLDSGLPRDQIAFAIDDRLSVIEEVWRANHIRVFPVYCRKEPLP